MRIRVRADLRDPENLAWCLFDSAINEANETYHRSWKMKENRLFPGLQFRADMKAERIR